MRFALLMLLACLTGCSVIKDGPVDCNDATALNDAVAHVVKCETDYCQGDTGPACTCVRSGKDFEPTSCGCTVALSESAQQWICKEGYAIGTDDNCGISQPRLANSIAGTACAGCTKDSQCLDHGTICTDGQCRPGCRGDNGCDTGTICETSVCRTGCRDDYNCDSSWQFCQQGACLGKACTRDLDCAPAHNCVAGKCQ